MFLLATRNRPEHLAAVIASMRSVGEPPEVAVMHDACPIYDIDWPKHWHLHTSAAHLEMAGAINALYKAHPGCDWYGYLNDHCHPLLEGWWQALRDSAGRFGVASATDTVQRTNPRTGKTRLNCYVLGGELVRRLGWVWPDFVVHLWGDDVIEDIGYELGVFRHVPEALMENRMLRDGSLKPDDNSRRIWRGIMYPTHDAQAYLQWRRHGFRPLVAELSEAIEAVAS